MLHVIANIDNPLTRFILNGLDGEADVRVIPTPARQRGMRHSIGRLVESLAGPVAGVSSVFDSGFTDQLRTIDADDQVLYFGFENSRDLGLVRRFIAAGRESLFLWNPVVRHGRTASAARRRIGRLQRPGMPVCTFDPADAQTYGLTLVDQVYRDVGAWADRSAAGADDIDLYFVGEDKGRLPVLREVQLLADQARLRTLFHVIADARQDQLESDSALPTRRRMSYEDNLLLVNRSRCLVEIVQRHQSGATLRTLEALFFDKKLLTNLPSCRQQAYYHPDRVFVLGEDDPQRLQAFMHTPTPPVPAALLARYDVRTWCRQFR